MEITLENIELVKDRTGVGFKEAKEALEASDGDVVDAIIYIENDINSGAQGRINAAVHNIVDTVKSYVQKGNVNRLMIKREEEVILNLSLTAGVLGTVLFPWAAVAGFIAAFGTKCQIQLVTDEGKTIDVSSKTEEVIDTAVSKGGVVVDEIVDKGSDIIDAVKDKIGR